jgi:catechol 2,3-dioxygenase-like lactoylglutathione lyase family enzyme
MHAHVRIARPVSVLERSVAMYGAGLELEELGRFVDHDGFDGVMLGHPGLGFHFEFTHNRHHRVIPSPTAEDLLVIYLPERDAWTRACQRMSRAGFNEVQAFNPYWTRRGRTFEDHDGYRVVIEQDAWRVSSVSPPSPRA